MTDFDKDREPSLSSVDTPETEPLSQGDGAAAFSAPDAEKSVFSGNAVADEATGQGEGLTKPDSGNVQGAADGAVSDQVANSGVVNFEDTSPCQANSAQVDSAQANSVQIDSSRTTAAVTDGVPASEGEAALSETPLSEEAALSADGAQEERTGGVDAMFAGIRISVRGPVYFMPKPDVEISTGDKVLVELEHGLALGEVTAIQQLFVRKETIEAEPVRFKALATAADIAQDSENKILSAEASAFCTTCIRQRELDMKLVDVEVMHDRSKLIFYFTAPSRIDFRDLVKDLVNTYRTRIELRQIGVRHETQMVGGIGNCGMVCCCHRYLRKFAPVTIKMAKEQNLFLNPVKLSGMCGRLLCCLSFEQSNYENFNRKCPKLGKMYVTDKGTVRVLRANMFRQVVTVLTEKNEETDIPLEEWLEMSPKRAEPQNQERPPRKEGREGRDGTRAGGEAAGQTAGQAEGEEGESRSVRRRPPGRPRPRRRKGRPGEEGGGDSPA